MEGCLSLVVGTTGSGTAGLANILFEGVVYGDEGGVFLATVLGAEEGRPLQDTLWHGLGLAFGTDNHMGACGGADMEPDVVGCGNAGREKIVGSGGLSHIDFVAFRGRVAADFMALKVGACRLIALGGLVCCS